MILALQFQSPGPIFFELGPISIRWYGLLIATAILLGVSFSQFLAKRRHFDPELIADLALWLVVAAIPSARLYYVLFNWSEYAQRPEDIIAIWKGGIAIHGAIIGGTIATTLFARFQKIFTILEQNKSKTLQDVESILVLLDEIESKSSRKYSNSEILERALIFWSRNQVKIQKLKLSNTYLQSFI